MRLQLLLFIFSIGWRGQLSKIIANLGPTFCIVCPHSDSWLCTAWTQKELSTHGNTNLFQNFATSFCLAGFFEPPPGLKTWGPAFKSRAACWANCAEHYELLPCEIYFPISEMNFPINAQLVPISAHLTLFSLQIGHGSSRYDCWFFFAEPSCVKGPFLSAALTNHTLLATSWQQRPMSSPTIGGNPCYDPLLRLCWLPWQRMAHVQPAPKFLILGVDEQGPYCQPFTWAFALQ